MSNRYIRIYEVFEPSKGWATLIGASRSAVDMFEDSRFVDFMTAQGKTVERMEEDEPLSYLPSIDYRTVRPPMDTEQIISFGNLCVGRMEEGFMHPPLIDAGSNEVFVIDNRETPPYRMNNCAAPIIASG